MVNDAGATPSAAPRNSGRNTFFVIVGIAAVAGLIWWVASGGLAEGLKPRGLQYECARIVAEWAGVDEADVTREQAASEQRVSEDWRGTYPGGEWACGGEKGKDEPNQVVVYPEDASVEGGVIYPKG